MKFWPFYDTRMVPGIEISDWDAEFISRAKALEGDFWSVTLGNPKSTFLRSIDDKSDKTFVENISIKNVLGLLWHTRNNIRRGIANRNLEGNTDMHEDEKFIREWLGLVRSLRADVHEQMRSVLDAEIADLSNEELLEKPYKALVAAMFKNPRYLRGLSYEDQQDGRLKNERFLAALKAVYQKLDRKNLRFDGTTHFSHAFETTLIMIREIGYFDDVMAYASLWHDFFEDVDYLGESEKYAVLKLILEDKDYPVYSHDREVIPLIESLSKKPEEYYLTESEIHDFGISDGHSVKGFIRDLENDATDPQRLSELKSLSKTLKMRRDADYYGAIIDVSKVPEGHDPELFVLRKLIIKCADRIHALRNMDMREDQKPLEKQVEMIEKKIRETHTYFFPQLEETIRRYETQNQGISNIIERTNKVFYLKRMRDLMFEAINEAEKVKFLKMADCNNKFDQEIRSDDILGKL